jgi:hypothetical protein
LERYNFGGRDTADATSSSENDDARADAEFALRPVDMAARLD